MPSEETCDITIQSGPYKLGLWCTWNASTISPWPVPEFTGVQWVEPLPQASYSCSGGIFLVNSYACLYIWTPIWWWYNISWSMHMVCWSKLRFHLFVIWCLKATSELYIYNWAYIGGMLPSSGGKSEPALCISSPGSLNVYGPPPLWLKTHQPFFQLMSWPKHCYNYKY